MAQAVKKVVQEDNNLVGMHLKISTNLKEELTKEAKLVNEELDLSKYVRQILSGKLKRPGWK